MKEPPSPYGQRLLTLKFVLKFWLRYSKQLTSCHYARIRANRLHFASTLCVASLLTALTVHAIHAAPAVFADGEQERIAFIVNTYLYPDTLQLNTEFGLHDVATTGQNVGGSTPSTTVPQPQQHIVKTGEALSTIAAAYGMSSYDFLAANPSLESRNAIYPGQVLAVPTQAATEDQIAKAKADEAKKVTATTKSKGTSASSNSVKAATKPVVAMVRPIHEEYISRGIQPGHTGADLVTPTGTTVRAATDGCATRSATGYNGGYGTVIIIKQSGTPISTLYGHLSKLLIQEGDCVSAGDPIGLSGNTGNSTGPHLHFEVRVNGQPVDPLKYIGR